MPVKSLPDGAYDEATVRKELSQGIKDVKYLERRRDDFLEDHRDEWVGVFKKLALFAPSLGELLDKARHEGWDVGLMAIDRLVEERIQRLSNAGEDGRGSVVGDLDEVAGGRCDQRSGWGWGHDSNVDQRGNRPEVHCRG